MPKNCFYDVSTQTEHTGSLEKFQNPWNRLAESQGLSELCQPPGAAEQGVRQLRSSTPKTHQQALAMFLAVGLGMAKNKGSVYLARNSAA